MHERSIRVTGTTLLASLMLLTTSPPVACAFLSAGNAARRTTMHHRSSDRPTRTIRNHCPPILFQKDTFATRLQGSKSSDSTNKRNTAPFIPAQQQQDYNDDAFGLVFLCCSFVAQDVIFSTLFVLLSAGATIAVKQNKMVFTNQIPAAVAGLSLGLATLLAWLLPPSQESGGILGDWLAAKTDTAMQVELIVCAISIIYGVVISPLLEKNKEKTTL